MSDVIAEAYASLEAEVTEAESTVKDVQAGIYNGPLTPEEVEEETNNLREALTNMEQGLQNVNASEKSLLALLPAIQRGKQVMLELLKHIKNIGVDVETLLEPYPLSRLFLGLDAE